MALTAADYRQQLQALLPWGPAWPRAEDATLTHLLDAFAQEFARLDARAHQLLDESIPRTTNELLSDWERVAGLPDNCAGVLRDSVAGRRQVLVSKLISVGGQSPAYFKAVAAEMGYLVQIEEYRSFRAGRARCGERLTNGPWRFAWTVRAAETTVRVFRVGSRAGERLASWGNADLECRIRQLAPAHTLVLFAYGGLANAILLMESGHALMNEDGAITLLGEKA